jgi:hypothetical protein
MKKILVFSMAFVLLSLAVFAHGTDTFAEAEEIILQKTECDQLSEDQLEKIGDYYMEQMHPGEAHEAMDELMGGEGSGTLSQMHIRMARAFYCGEHGEMSSGMMSMMMGKFNNKNSGMMDGGGGMSGGMWIYGLLYIALAAFVFGIIFWWTYKLIVKDGKNNKKR